MPESGDSGRRGLFDAVQIPWPSEELALCALARQAAPLPNCDVTLDPQVGTVSSRRRESTGLNLRRLFAGWQAGVRQVPRVVLR